MFQFYFFRFSYSYVRQTKLASSLVNFWAHYKIVWLIDWSVLMQRCKHVMATNTNTGWSEIFFATTTRACDRCATHRTRSTSPSELLSHRSSTSWVLRSDLLARIPLVSTRHAIYQGHPKAPPATQNRHGNHLELKNKKVREIWLIFMIKML